MCDPLATPSTPRLCHAGATDGELYGASGIRFIARRSAFSNWRLTYDGYGLIGFMSGHRFGFWLAAALVQCQQGQAQFDVRALGDASCKIAHGRLLALAKRGDFLLTEAALLEIRYE